MWIIRNLRCHYLQNTITNSEKIFDTNSINHFTNIAKVLRGGVSELIGNYEYLRILPQPRACLKNKSCTKHIFPRPFS